MAFRHRLDIYIEEWTRHIYVLYGEYNTASIFSNLQGNLPYFTYSCNSSTKNVIVTTYGRKIEVLWNCLKILWEPYYFCFLSLAIVVLTSVSVLQQRIRIQSLPGSHNYTIKLESLFCIQRLLLPRLFFIITPRFTNHAKEIWK